MKRLLLCLFTIYFALPSFGQTFETRYIGNDGFFPANGKDGNGKGFSTFPITVKDIGDLGPNNGVLSVSVDIENAFAPDLVLMLQSPDGERILLANKNGLDGDSFANYKNTVFSSYSTNSITKSVAPFTGVYSPMNSLGNFNHNRSGDGVWKLLVLDANNQGSGFDGKVKSWSISFGNRAIVLAAPSCTTNGVASPDCSTAPFVCNFNGLCGQTPPPTTPKYWPELNTAFSNCLGGASIENNSFVKFVAQASTATFNVWVSGCFSGIQMFFFNNVCGSGAVTGYGCNGLNPNPIPPDPNIPTVITANGLTVGQTYYLMFDGFGGDACNYTIQPISGVNTLSLTLTPDSTTVCQGVVLNLNATGGLIKNYNWTSSSTPSGLSGTSGPSVLLNTSLLTVPVIDTVTVHVQSSVGNCNDTSSVIIKVLPQTNIPASTPTYQVVNNGTPAIPLTIGKPTTGVTYQWYSNTVASTVGGTPIAGATSTTYLPPSNKSTTTYYYCLVSNSVCLGQTNIDTVKVISSCPIPDTLRFSQQPTNVNQGSYMKPSVSVLVFCKVAGLADTYNGKVTITAKDGCTYFSQTVTAVGGIATFDSLLFTRSIQNGITLNATAQNVPYTAVNAPFNVLLPGPPVVTKTVLRDDNFNPNPVIEWPFTIGTPVIVGTTGTQGSDVTGVVCNLGNCYLNKSYSVNNGNGGYGTKTTITFDDNPNLSKYDSLDFTFQVASLEADGSNGTIKTGCNGCGVQSGAGADAGEDFVVDVSINGGTTWSTILTHRGQNNKLFPFVNKPVTNLIYGQNTIISGTTYSSAFKLTLTPKKLGINQFQFRVTAQNNRIGENWAIDTIELVATQVDTIFQLSTPSVVASSSTSTICSGNTVSLSASASNVSGSVTYSWSPVSGFSNPSDTALQNPTTAPLNSGQVYTVKITDNTGCTAISNPISITISPSVVINTQPSTNPINACQNVTLSQPLTITATAATSYQWYQNATPSNIGGTPIAGATNSSYTPPTTTIGTVYYYCVVSGACKPSITSDVSGPVNILPAGLTVPAISSASNQLCVGNTLQLSNSLTGGTWISDNKSVATVNVTTGAVTGLTPGTANITYTVSGSCGSSSSPQFTVTVLGAPIAGTLTGANPVCSGNNSTTLTLNPPAVGNVTWQSSTDNINYTTIAGQSGQTYTATNLSVPTYYQVIVSNGVCPSVKGNFVLVQVNPKPVAGVISGASPVCSGKNSTTLTLTGSTGSIIWYSSTDGINYTPISGQTSSTYISTNLNATTYYEAVVSNGGGCVADTAKTSIVVNPSSPASITVNANNNTICAGDNVIFTANPTNQGTTPFFQWLKNGVAITGATAATYSNSSLSNGDSLACILQSSASCVFPATDTSKYVKVTVNSSPSISIQPSTINDTTCPNGTLNTLTLTATNGTTYQWYQNATPSNTGGSIIVGAISSSYTPPPTATVGTTYYYCVVTGNCNPSVTSNVSGAFVVQQGASNAPPITSSSSNVCVNGSLQLNNSIGGGAWTSDNTSVATVNPTTGLVNGLTVGTANITYTVTSACGTGVSPKFPINVLAPVRPGTITGNVAVCSGINSTSLTLNPSVTGNITWQSSTDSITFTTITGATGQTYTATNLTIPTYYQVIVSNGVCPDQKGSPVLVQVVPKPIAGSLSTPIAVCAGNNSTTLTLTGSFGNISWLSSTDSITYTTILGQSGNTLTQTNINKTTYYLAVVSNATCGPDTARTTLKVTLPLPTSVSITANNSTICSGDVVQFTASPTNGGTTPVYQWLKNGVVIAGATSPTYSNTGLSSGDSLACILQSSATCVFPAKDTSNYIKILVNPSPSITIQPSSINDTTCPNGPLSALSVTASNGTSYQWYQNTLPTNTGGTIIAGATSASYTPPSTATVGTTYYYCVVSGNCNPNITSSVSGAFVVQKGATNAPPITSTTNNVCTNSSIQLNNAIGGGAWSSDNTSVATVNPTTGLVTGITVGTANITYTVTSACGTGVSPKFPINVLAPAQPGTITGNLQICSGGNTTLALNPSATGNITWQSSTDNINFTTISGATGQTYITTDLTVPTYYQVIVGNGVCADQKSSAVLVQLVQKPVAGSLSTPTAVCSGNNTSTLTLTGFSGNISWQFSTDSINYAPIIGQTGSTLFQTNINNTTYYLAIVSNGTCIPDTAKTILKVIPSLPVSISLTANKTNICSGDTVLFTASYTNSGTAPVYQWLKNGVVIAGATLATYSNSGLSDGDSIACVLNSNAICASPTTVTSNYIKISIGASPTISVQPSSAVDSICPNGQFKSLSVTATNGTGYQWYRTSSPLNSGGTIIAGATSNTYTPSYTGVIDTSYYYCVVSGVCNTNVTSGISGARIVQNSISNPPIITSATGNVCINNTLQLNNAVAGGVWISDNTSVATINPSTGVVTGLVAGSANITYTVNSGCGKGVSPKFTVNVLSPAQPGAITGNAPVCGGSNSTTLNLSPSATGNIVWQSSIDNINYTTIAGATGQSYTATNLSVPTYFQVIVGNGVCPDQKGKFVLVQVNQQPQAGTIPTPSAVCSGTNTTTLSLTGSLGNISWQTSNDGVNFTTIAGATGQTYTATNLTGPTYFQVIASNVGCPAQIGSPVFVKVDQKPQRGTISTPSVVCSGNNTTTLSLTGSFGSIAWLISSDSLNFTPIAGQMSSSLIQTNLVATTYYQAVVSNGSCSPVTSSTVIKVTPSLPVNINVTPDKSSICSGSAVLFTATSTNAGSNPVYQWQKNGTNVGTNSTTYTDATLVSTDIISCTLTSNAVCAQSATNSSSPISISVNQPTSSVTNGTVCDGTSYTFNGVAYTIPGNYTVHITNNAGCDSTAKLVLKVKPKVVPTFATLSICNGDVAPSLPSGSIEGITGIWQPATIDNTTTASYSFTPSSGQCALSTQFQVIVNNKPKVSPIVTVSSEVDVNQTVTLTNATLGGTWSVTPIDIANIDANGVLMALAPGVATVTYTVPNLVNPCGDGLADLSITIISPNVYIPNIFSPNGDGHNDVFFIRGNKFITKSVELSVYSPWGAQLFHSISKVDDASFGWDGNYNGKVQPTGVYTYIAKVVFNNGQTVTKKGSISLIR